MFKAGNDTKLYHDALTIRKEVFIEEQGVPKDLEIDQYEQTCQYIVAYNNHTPIATARYREVDGCVKVERVAVVRSARGQHVGHHLMEALENDALSKGYRCFKLGAQVQAIPFYEKLGYQTYGDRFMDAGIPHYHMYKSISE